MVRSATRRLSGTVGARARGRVRARDACRHLRAFDRVAAAARPPPAEGPSRVRLRVPDHSAAGYRSDDLAPALTRTQGAGSRWDPAPNVRTPLALCARRGWPDERAPVPEERPRVVADHLGRRV